MYREVRRVKKFRGLLAGVESKLLKAGVTRAQSKLLNAEKQALWLEVTKHEFYQLRAKAKYNANRILDREIFVSFQNSVRFPIFFLLTRIGLKA